TEIDTIIWQSTAKNPTHRYDNVLELAVAFQGIADKMGTVPLEYRISTEHHRRLEPRQENVVSTNILSGVGALTATIDDSTTDSFAGLADIPQIDERNLETIFGLTDTNTPNLESPSIENADTLYLDEESDTEIIETLEFEMDDFPDSNSENNTPPLSELDAPESVEVASEDSEEGNRYLDYRKAMMLSVKGQGPPNPYKGLRAFEAADEGTFFGREDLVNHLVAGFEQPENRFLALIGPSGSGKSSVVRAGLIPTLSRGAVSNSDRWFYSTMIPSDNPFRELRQAILKVAMIAPEKWGNDLEADVRGLHKLLNHILPNDGSDLLLFIDQFEEVFTLEDDESRREMFLNSLWFAVNQPNSRLRLIITLRADFYDRPLHYPQFGQMLKEYTEVVLPLSLRALESTIVGPADYVGLEIEPALKTAILNDVHNQPGTLPLLQYALTELYERKSADEVALTYDAYLSIGGIEGALAQRAEEIYATLTPDEQAIVRKLFLRIIAIDDNGTVTRRRVLLSEMRQGIQHPELLEKVLNAFSDYRLLTNDLDQTTRTPTIEVAHEALIKGWAQLSQWIEQNRFALQKRQELRVDVDRWLASERDKSYLATGSRLIEFEGIVNNDLLSLRDEEREYINSSILLRAEEANRQRRTTNILRVFSTVALLFFILALVAAYFANDARADAVTQAQVARSRELSSASLANDDDPDLAMLLAVEAISIDETYDTRHSLLSALQLDSLVQRYFHEHTNGLRTVDFDSTGTIAVAGGLTGQDNTLLRWDMTTETVIGEPLFGHTSWINEVDISSDNLLVASGSNDATVRIWDMTTGEQLTLLEEHTSPVRSVTFSLDNSILASAGEDGQIILWDVATGNITRTIDVPTDAEGDVITVFDVDFNSTGTLLLSAGSDNLIHIWDVATGDIITELVGHIDWVNTAQFDPTDSVIISGDNDGVIYFWDVESGQSLVGAGGLNTSSSDDDDGIDEISLSFDSAFMATSHNSGQVLIWQLGSEIQNIALIEAHSDRVRDVVFSPIDYRLLSASDDGTMLLMQLTAVQRPGRVLFDVPQTIEQLAIDPTSPTIAISGTIGDDMISRIQVMNRETGDLRYEFTVNELSDVANATLLLTTDLIISSDGTLGAVSLSTGEIAVWALDNGDLLWIDNQHDATIPQGLAFTPDNDRLISADEAGTVIVWDVASGETIENNFYAPETGVTALAISPNGQYLVIGGRTSSILWNLLDETLITDTMTEHSNAVEAFTFSADSTTLFTASRDRTIGQWSTENGAFIQRFEGHGDWVLSLTLNPAGDILISGDRAGLLRIWDVASARQIGNVLDGPFGWMTALHFVDDGTVIGSNREGNQGTGVVLSWAINTQDWIQLACDISNRDLSDSELSQYIHGADYIGRCSG
ncbi:MAG: WD40 repeat domain-containing protein, partial [Chloroflexota bacterium]